MNIISGIGESGFLANSAFSAGIATKDSNGNDITATYLTGVDLTPYQTTAGMTAYQVAGDYYSASNPSGFVTSGELPDPVTIGVQEGDTLDTDYDGLKIVKSTANGNEHINLHKKSTDQWLIHGGLVPTSPGSNKYLVTDDSGAMHWDNKSALAYDSAFEQSGGYITAYNGSAFKAGDELPSGVMVESGLEYNAVNEISGYNGSAIAQYGAEKQWLQHDDTLVHAANSAQYALGVNLSAVAQLLGVDETVLWEGAISTTAQSGTMIDQPKNYNYLDLYFKWNGNYSAGRAVQVRRFVPDNLVEALYSMYASVYNIMGGVQYKDTIYVNCSNDKGITLVAGKRQNDQTYTSNVTAYNFNLVKVVGIGKKN